MIRQASKLALPPIYQQGGGIRQPWQPYPGRARRGGPPCCQLRQVVYRGRGHVLTTPGRRPSVRPGAAAVSFPSPRSYFLSPLPPLPSPPLLSSLSSCSPPKIYFDYGKTCRVIILRCSVGDRRIDGGFACCSLLPSSFVSSANERGCFPNSHAGRTLVAVEETFVTLSPSSAEVKAFFA